MSLTKKLKNLAMVGALAFGAANAKTKAEGILYDDFEVGYLDPAKWRLRTDPEGQPPFTDYQVAPELGNWVFHTYKNEPEDRRVYLVPTHIFRTNDELTWETDVRFRYPGLDYSNLILIKGEEYTGVPPNRGQFSAVGYFSNRRPPQEPFDAEGLTKVRIQFQPDKVQMTSRAPSGQEYIRSLPLQNPLGSYEMYIGTFSGVNGIVHIDYDNFYLIPEPPIFFLLASAGALALTKRKNGKGSKKLLP